jgi:hypothetical protein
MVRHSRPYKKDLTPIGKGGITTHVGKGATEQRGFGGSLTRGSPLGSAMNRYPKPMPEPDMDDAGPSPAPAPASILPSGAPGVPTAMMPPMPDNDADDAA